MNFTDKNFSIHDDYMTPLSAWEAIKEFIPKNKVIWECFYGNGESGEHLRSLGFNVIHEPVDFYTHSFGDVLVSNPPFSDTKNVMKRLAILDKPFIMIMPSSKLNTQHFRESFKGKIQLIVPKKRMNFKKFVNGVCADKQGTANFDTLYYCYKIGLPDDITWL